MGWEEAAGAEVEEEVEDGEVVEEVDGVEDVEAGGVEEAGDGLKQCHRCLHYLHHRLELLEL